MGNPYNLRTEPSKLKELGVRSPETQRIPQEGLGHIVAPQANLEHGLGVIQTVGPTWTPNNLLF